MSTDSPQEPVRILLVEDNPADAELLQRQLVKDGFAADSRVVTGEHEYRRCLTEFAPHVILSDFTLPGFDGLAALDIARVEAPNTPFIFVSGTIGEERAIEALKRGAADYVLKGGLRRLVPAIRSALRQAQAARERDIAEQLLRSSESRLRDIVNTSHDWIWECDRDGCFTFSSPSVSRVLGYEPHELLGRSCFQYVDPADEGSLRAALAAIATQRGGGMKEITLRWRHKNGALRWLERHALALREGEGEVVGFRGIDRDVSLRKAQEARIARLNRALRFLSKANSAIIRIRDRDLLLKEACRLAVRVGGYSLAAIYVQRGKGKAPLVYRIGSVELAEGGLRLRNEPMSGNGPVARALASGEPVLVKDLADRAVEVPQRERLLDAGLRACLALPLVIDGTPIGVLQLHSEDAAAYGDAELALLRQVTDNITFSLQYLQSKDTVQYLEYFDPLTALAKRPLFLQRLQPMLEHAQRTEGRLALLVIDIEGLGAVNDSLGHHAGDLLLQAVAERMKDAVGGTNGMCHLGGGCYAALSPQAVGSADAAAELKARVDRVFATPFGVAGRELRASVRAGLAQFPEDGQEAEVLLQRAQTALAHAKQAGEQLLRHRPDMSLEAAERLNVTNRLRRAVAERKFTLSYQPKLCLRSGQVKGVEALLRWPDSEQGSVAPSVFVPMLESNGLIEEVGAWVIGRALSETSEWRHACPPGFRVAVNVSPVQLKREGFIDDVFALLTTADGGAERLELEVTESTLMSDIQKTAGLLARLRDAGISVAIDDFGTGHSSLQLLTGLPVDVLKIDRSFVTDIASNARHRLVVQTTIKLAESLGVRTVAEGVETEQQLDVLRELGCDAAQGYLIHRPAPGSEIRSWLMERGSG